MKKVAKLVYIDSVVRIIVDENATDEEIHKHVSNAVLYKIQDNSIIEDITNIKDDSEVPYDDLLDDEKLFQSLNQLKLKL